MIIDDLITYKYTIIRTAKYENIYGFNYVLTVTKIVIKKKIRFYFNSTVKQGNWCCN